MDFSFGIYFFGKIFFLVAGGRFVTLNRKKLVTEIRSNYVYQSLCLHFLGDHNSRGI